MDYLKLEAGDTALVVRENGDIEFFRDEEYAAEGLIHDRTALLCAAYSLLKYDPEFREALREHLRGRGCKPVVVQ